MNKGHEVRMMPAQYVAPHVQTNKSDWHLDAVAIVGGAAAENAICADQDGGAARFAALHRCARALGDAGGTVVNQIRVFLNAVLTLPKRPRSG